jgi:aryl carrier-like protein
MMKTKWEAATSIQCSLSAGQREVLARVHAFVDAVSTHDVDAARELLLPGATSVKKRPDGSVSVQSSDDFFAALGSSHAVWRERIWHPTVLVQGDIAQVWVPYDFHIDGKLSHCGIDSISLVRMAGDWRIAGISYTIHTQGCKPSPLDTKKGTG